MCNSRMHPYQFIERAAIWNGGGRERAPLFLILAACVALLFMACPVLSAEITPFYSQNQSPLVQIFGLPPAGNAIVVPPGRGEGVLALDVASNFAKQSNAGSGETILLDGESYRTTLAFRYGLTKGVEAGIELPFVAYGGGFLDGFIVGWHSFFQLPQGGRKEAPHNRLLYAYSRNGEERLRIDDSSGGVGDLRLTGGVQLYNDGRSNPRTLALRASLKLPTGDSARLLGSGSTDFALWLTGSDDYGFPAWGHLTGFAAVGGMWLSDGDVLRGQQRNLAGFGTIGFGWSPAEVIAFKTQLSGHTPFYRGSELRELNYSALQLLIGGTIAFSGGTALDIGVSEDLAVNTSPDVAFHLSLSRRF
jgi:uncharacterized protein DUF3187